MTAADPSKRARLPSVTGIVSCMPNGQLDCGIRNGTGFLGGTSAVLEREGRLCEQLPASAAYTLWATWLSETHQNDQNENSSREVTPINICRGHLLRLQQVAEEQMHWLNN